MKLSHADALMKISDLSFLNEAHMLPYKNLFPEALDWLVRNPPGVCCIDMRGCLKFSDQLDASFFTLNNNGDARVRRKPAGKIYFLEQTHRNASICFSIMPLQHWCGHNRMSFDWIHKSYIGLQQFVEPEAAIAFHKFGLRLHNRFYVTEEIVQGE